MGGDDPDKGPLGHVLNTPMAANFLGGLLGEAAGWRCGRSCRVVPLVDLAAGMTVS